MPRMLEIMCPVPSIAIVVLVIFEYYQLLNSEYNWVLSTEYRRLRFDLQHCLTS